MLTSLLLVSRDMQYVLEANLSIEVHFPHRFVDWRGRVSQEGRAFVLRNACIQHLACHLQEPAKCGV